MNKKGNNKSILSDDLRYLIFSDLYLRFHDPKARRKAFMILENAIHCFDQKGFDSVTFKMIARESTMTPPSLRYYFSDLRELRDTALKYTHLIAQKIVVEAMTQSSDPAQMLRDYLHAHYFWASSYRSHIRVWLSYLTYCSRTKKTRSLNTEAVQNGANRIADLLGRGRKAGVFHHKNDMETARHLQTVILGWLSTVVTENIANEKEYSSGIVRECMRMVGVQN